METVHIVQVCRVVWPFRSEVGHGKQSANGKRGLVRLGQSRVSLGFVVIVGAQNQARIGELGTHRLRHWTQPAGVERNRYSMPSCFVNASAGRIALDDADRVARLANRVIATV